MYLEKNLATLRLERRNQGIESLIETVAPADDIALFETAAGDYTLEWRGVLLHHEAGAVAEAKAICAPESNLLHPGLRSNHIILGLGLGYLLDEAFQQSKGRIFVYEPNLPLLRFVLENVDLSEHLGSRRVYLAGSLKTLFDQFRARFITGEMLDVLVTQGYAQLFAPEINTIMGSLLRVVEDQKANVGVGLNYHQDWVRQFLKNLKQIPVTLPFELLNNRFKDKPALVVSAGPSLDLAIETIQQNQDKFVIVAVGSALRALLAKGIQPDFVAFLDFSGPREQLANLPGQTDASRFLLGPFVQDECFTQANAGSFLLSLDNYPVFSSFLDQCYHRSATRIESGATVSMMALQCARAMGCNPLILVGQDLAIKDDQLYAGGIKADISADGYLSTEASDTMVARKMKLMEVQGWNGEPLKTTPDYYDYRFHLEELAAQISEEKQHCKLFNASVGGARIEGFEHLPLAEIIASQTFTPMDKDSLLSGLTEENPVKPEAVRASVSSEVKRLIQMVNDIIAQTKPLAALLEKMVATPKDRWGTLEQTMMPEYRERRSKLSAQLDQEKFIEYCLKKEIWELQESFQFDASKPEDYFHNLQADLRYFKAVLVLLQDKLLPWLNQAVSQEVNA